MTKKHTILAPQMSPIHFQFFEEAIRLSGYNIEALTEESPNIIEEGLKYVNINFFMSCTLNTIYKHKVLEGKGKNRFIGEGTISILNLYLKVYIMEFKNSKGFKPPQSIRHLAKNTAPIVSLCNKTG